MKRYDVIVQNLDGTQETEAVVRSYEVNDGVFIGYTSDGPVIINTRNVRAIVLTERF